eukprot:GDKK01052220.1.p1 GENE.GDKK01052220.1~~GDKK01052220.1.p1  ORF type:complete len:900 (-),score=177.74 GDKK01052220.1:137-2836(-)
MTTDVMVTKSNRLQISENGACDDTRKTVVLQQLISHIKSSWKAYGIPYTHQHLFARKYFNSQANVEVYAALMEEADALVREESVVQFVTRAIGYREFLLRRLYQLEISASSVEDSLKKNIQDSLFEVLIELRNASVQVVEAIDEWRQSVSIDYRKPRGSSAHSIDSDESFEHIVWLHRDETAHPPRYRNYLLKLKTDTQWLHGSKLGELANFSPKCDPFFITPSIASKAEAQNGSLTLPRSVSKPPSSNGMKSKPIFSHSPARVGVRGLLASRNAKSSGAGSSVASAASVMREVKSRRVPLTRTEIVRINEAELVLVEEAVIARARRYALERKMSSPNEAKENQNLELPVIKKDTVEHSKAEHHPKNFISNLLTSNDASPTTAPSLKNVNSTVSLPTINNKSESQSNGFFITSEVHSPVHDQSAPVKNIISNSSVKKYVETIDSQETVHVNPFKENHQKATENEMMNIEKVEKNSVDNISQRSSPHSQIEKNSASYLHHVEAMKIIVPQNEDDKINSGDAYEDDFEDLNSPNPRCIPFENEDKNQQEFNPAFLNVLDSRIMSGSAVGSLGGETAAIMVSDSQSSEMNWVNAVDETKSSVLGKTFELDFIENTINGQVSSSSSNNIAEVVRTDCEWTHAPSDHEFASLKLQKVSGMTVARHFKTHYWPRLDNAIQTSSGDIDFWTEGGALISDRDSRWFFIFRENTSKEKNARAHLESAYENTAKLTPVPNNSTRSFISQALPYNIDDEEVESDEEIKSLCQRAHGLVVIKKSDDVGYIAHLSMVGPIEDIANLEDLPSLIPPSSYSSKIHLRHILATIRRAMFVNSSIQNIRTVLMCPKREVGELHKGLEKAYCGDRHFRWFSLQQDGEGNRGQINQAMRSSAVDPVPSTTSLNSIFNV